MAVVTLALREREYLGQWRAFDVIYGAHIIIGALIVLFSLSTMQLQTLSCLRGYERRIELEEVKRALRSE